MESFNLTCGQCLLIPAQTEKYHQNYIRELFVVSFRSIFGLLIFEIFDENGMRRKQRKFRSRYAIGITLDKKFLPKLMQRALINDLLWEIPMEIIKPIVSFESHEIA